MELASRLSALRAAGASLRQKPDPELMATVLQSVHDSQPRVARYAVRALAQMGPMPELEALLVSQWRSPHCDLPLRKALARAMAVHGQVEASALLSNHNQYNDPELTRLAQHAMLNITRRQHRQQPSAQQRAGSLRDLRLHLLCRAGLEAFLLDELRQLDPSASTWQQPQVLGPGRVEVAFSGDIQAWSAVRIAHSARLPLTFVPLGRGGGDEDQAIAAAILQAVAKAGPTMPVLQLQPGAVRWRLAWHGAGRRHKLKWLLAAKMAQQQPRLLNDPDSSDWQLHVTPHARAGREGLFVEWEPRDSLGERFYYRERDVPAASHPPLAAALVRLAGLRTDDVVWDPFVGSGTELIERALAGPAARLLGTDIAPAALTAAKTNAERARVDVELLEANALSYRAIQPTLILSNPPLGRRVARSEGPSLLDDFLRHASLLLKPQGRLVWITPHAARHRQLAESLGLRLSFQGQVDMGGFAATMQKFIKA